MVVPENGNREDKQPQLSTVGLSRLFGVMHFVGW